MSNKKFRPPNKQMDSFFLLVFGVLIPALAIGFETSTHMCATAFFDPLPSPAHTFLFALIPLCNLLTVIGLWKDASAFYAINSLLNGMAMGIAVLYAIMFLPILPYAAIGTIIGSAAAALNCLQLVDYFFNSGYGHGWPGFELLGAGLSGLAPYFSLITLPRAGSIVVQQAEEIGTFVKPKQLHHLGHLIVLITVVAVELPSTLTRYWLMEAARPQTTPTALTMLRQFGNREVLLRACYEHSGHATDILGSLAEMITPVKTETAQNIFYRVTGQPYNSLPIPQSARAARSSAAHARGVSGFERHSNIVPQQASTVVVHSNDEFDYDTNIAGETVSGVARGLSMADSRIRAWADTEAATAKLTWTMSFENSSSYEREARCRFILPPNAVITGARLHLKDKTKEAIIQPRGEARVLYQAAAQERKNPLLISTYGKDRIMMQCFPVRTGEKFTAELDIACPLQLKSLAKAELRLPKFEERNFPIPETHHFTLSCTPAGQGAAGKPAQIKSVKLGTPDAVFTMERDSSICKLATRNNTGNAHNTDSPATFIQETMEAAPPALPQHIYILIDGSETMTKHFPAIAKALETLPRTIPCRIIMQKDKTIWLTNKVVTPASGEFKEALSGLKNMQGVGGQIDSAALTQIIKEARKQKGTAIIWLHGAQPVLDQPHNTQALGRMLRKTSSPTLFDFQVNAGPNRILENMSSRAKFFDCSVSGDLNNDFARLTDYWTRPNYHTACRLVDQTGADTKIVENQELIKLWANQNIAGLLAMKKRPEATQEALLYKLVTPVSSAVIADVPAWRQNPSASRKGHDSGSTKLLAHKHLAQTSSSPASLPHKHLPQASLSPPPVPKQLVPDQTGSPEPSFNEASSQALQKPATPKPGGIAGLMIPIAPESDTWILLAIAGLIGLAYIFKQRKIVSSKQ